MDLSIDKSLASPYVQTNSIDGSKKILFPYRKYKTNPIEKDSFKKNAPVIYLPYNGTDKMYQKLLETVAPSVLFDSYLDEKAVQRMISQNPRIREILKKHETPLTINVDNVKDIKNAHINSTVNYSRGIAEKLNLSKADKDTIAKGARFHDYGKILIPKHILNKAGKLTPEEKRIVDLHSTLGYELLKTTNLDPKVLKIVKDHHRSLDRNPDYKTQIVSVADIYSALRSQRSYKETLSKEQSMQILNKYAQMGKIDPEIIKALDLYEEAPEAVAV